jgi:hypothetical protein
MGCIVALFGIVMPRFVLFVSWYNAPEFWNQLLGSQLVLGLGFLFLPWTTLIYGVIQPNGISLIGWIFLIFAFLADLATWGGGVFGSRKQVSNYRGT